MPDIFPKDLDAARDFLRAEAARVAHDPVTNSVATLAYAWFSALESGAAKPATLSALASDLQIHLASARAERLRAQHAFDGTKAFAALTPHLDALAAQGFAAYRAALERPRAGVVFTGHPTFAQSPDVRAAMARLAEKPGKAREAALASALKQDPRLYNGSITLTREHEETQAALAHAHEALRAFLDFVIAHARAHFPDDFRQLRPACPTLASWVGYDLDGRTDIQWWHSLAFRLDEKAAQLERYGVRARALSASGEAKTRGEKLAHTFENAAQLTRKQAALFRADLTEESAFVAAANALSGAHAHRLTDARSVLTDISAIADAVRDADAAGWIAFACEIETLQLGTARIHLRVNAAQVRTVLARDLELETEDRELGRLALAELARRFAKSKPLPVNFADLMLEQASARRQFMLCAQILKHVDAGAPIRFLIAESENPATVMGALYLARQYGVDPALDISPLFETPEALETGGRFIERLLEEPAFIDHIKTRGALSIQLGFSDSGRFIGQIAANMAIERIHNLIIRALERSKAGVDLLIFNTHGESLGRGAFPGSFTERFDHLLSPWTRAGAAARGVHLRHETSFQGGDGFLHFATPALALSTYAAVAAHAFTPPPKAIKDDFYIRTDLVWDFYRGLRAWHERLFNNPDYGVMLSGFALGLTVNAGSRQRRRPRGSSSPRDLRAISHNGVLQQLGVLANSAAGIGSALHREFDRLVQLMGSSARMRHLMTLAIRARTRTSLPALRAYARVYESTTWVLMARQSDGPQAAAYRALYYVLRDDETANAIGRMANLLSVDVARFDRLIAQISGAASIEMRHEERLDAHVLHALRQALMMRAFALTARLPRISERHDLSQRDLVRLALDLQIKDTIALVSKIFPRVDAAPAAYQALEEAGSGHSAADYARIHREIVRPLDEIDRDLAVISLAFTHLHGAYG